MASKGKKKMEIVSHMVTLAEKTRFKDEAKQRLMEAELARCTFAPTISARSKEIAASRARASKDDSHAARHAQLTTNVRNKLEPPASSVTPLHQMLQKVQSRVSQSIVKQHIRDGKRTGPIEEHLLQAGKRRKEKMAEAEGAKLEQVERDMASSRATLALDLSMTSAVAGTPGGKTALAKRAMATSHRLFSLSSARDDKILHLQSEALEKEREQCAHASAVLPYSRYLARRRGSLSPPKFGDEGSPARPGLSTPKGMGHTHHAIQDGRWASLHEVENHFMKSLRLSSPAGERVGRWDAGEPRFVRAGESQDGDDALATPAPPLSQRQNFFP